MSTTIKILCANNAVGKLSSPISANDTSLVLSGSEGGYFPNPTEGASAFYATLEDDNGNIETVLVTAKTNNTFTILRAQSGTTARSWPSNTEISNRVTAELLEDKVCLKQHTTDMATKLDKAGGTMTGGLAFSGNASITASNGTASSTLEIVAGGTAKLNGVNLALLAYPVGACYWSFESTSPAVLFGGGTWVQLQDTFLIACGTTYAAASTGGAATHTLTIAELPAHDHSGATSAEGGHTHSRGTMNITGTFGRCQQDYDYRSGMATGAFTITTYRGHTDGSNGTDDIGYYDFDASRSWTGATSEVAAHTHTITSQGSGTAISIMPPYVAVYVWKRTA